MIDLRGFVRKNKGFLSTLCFILAIVLMFWTVNSPAIVGASASTRLLPVYCVEREEKIVALSFDAAWGNEDTQTLIDILNKYGINTTFFVVGDWVDKFPESVKALHDAGHEIMNHSDDHPYFTKLSADQIKAQLDSCNSKIEAITGVRPDLFRPPYGDYNDSVVSTVRNCGMYTIQWNIEGSQTAESLDIPRLSAFFIGALRQQI